MLNNVFISPPKVWSRRELIKRGLSLLISMAAHAVMLILLVTYYAPVKIFDFGEVRNVFIAPEPEKLFLPGSLEDSAPGIRSYQTGILEPITSAAAVASAEAGETRPDPELSLPPTYEIPARISTDFRLERPPEPSPQLPSGLVFQLARPPTGLHYDYSPPAPRTGSLRKYLPAADARLAPFSGAAGDRESGPGPGLGVRGAPVARRADITEWAQQAVAMILNNWLVPLLLPDQEQDEFEIALIVQKDGWIASTEVIRTASIPQLQQAALKALELSTPLPRLPREFPEKSLELRLVFSRK
jgi:hypothetical protein